MDYRKLALASVGSALIFGCSGPAGTVFPERDFVCATGEAPPCATTTPRRTDAQRTEVEPEDFEDRTVSYIVNLIDVPSVAGTDPAPGFNLDGLDSGEGSTDPAATCEELAPDHTSSVDAGLVGVDNALAGAVTLLQGFACMGQPAPCTLGTLAINAINEGSVLLILEVRGLNSFEYDGAIELQFYLGALAGGATCDAAGGPAPCPTLEGGVLAAGQTFDTMAPLGSVVQGDVFDGRLRVRTSLLTLTLVAGGNTINLNITEPEVRFDIAEAGLSAGVIGGVLTLTDLVSLGAMFGVDQATILGVVGSFLDVRPSAADPTACEAISVGLNFEATTVVRNP